MYMMFIIEYIEVCNL